MAIPGYQDFMLPLLKVAADSREYTMQDVLPPLAEEFDISESEQDIMIASGTQTKFYNRVAWAVTYLTKSCLIEKVTRGRFRITDRGLKVLKENPTRIDNKYLARFPEYQTFRARKPVDSGSGESSNGRESASDDFDVTPEERLGAAYLDLRESLADDLLRRVRAGTPKFFEHLVFRLLLAMGYGHGQWERAKVTGKSGDDGIDCVIPQDRLELDMVYVQAKRHENSVGPGDIDKFIGSLSRKNATKGVFITSGSFTDGAERACREAKVKLRLIDGDELAEMMIDYNVGVTPADSYVVKKIDTDFFEGLSL